MPIKVTCRDCSANLKVPDTAAGKRIKCPKCGTINQVPAADASASEEKWHIQTEEGESYGPIPKNELDEWVAEGRITADCQLLLDGGDQWQWASAVYPQLDGSSSESAPAESSNPFDFASSDATPSAGIGPAVSTGGTTVATKTTATKTVKKTSSGGTGEKKILTEIGIFSFAKVAATSLALFSLVISIPGGLIMMLISLLGGADAAAFGFFGAIMFMVGLPIAYAISGFIGGLIYGLILNLVLRIAGGLEFTFKDA